MTWAPDYLDAEEAADFLRLGEPSEEEAVDLAGFVTATSRAIDRSCGRQFGLVETPEVRFYTPIWSRTRDRWTVRIDDLMTTTGLVAKVYREDGTEVGAFSYVLGPRNAAAEGEPWTAMTLLPSSAALPGAGDELGITAGWGWTAFPAIVVTACKLQLGRFWARRQSPFGIAGSPDQGSEMRLLAKVDPDVDVMLQSVRRPGWVAR